MTIRRLTLALLLSALLAGCAPRPATPAVDQLATTVAGVAFSLLTQTAFAASPTPPPTQTATPQPPANPTPNVTATPEHMNPITTTFAACYFGPGPSYTLESNIKNGKRVEVLGLGSEPGWFIIRNPYFHRPCWIAATDLKFDPGVNTVDLPVMTPGIPLMGQ